MHGIQSRPENRFIWALWTSPKRHKQRPGRPSTFALQLPLHFTSGYKNCVVLKSEVQERAGQLVRCC